MNIILVQLDITWGKMDENFSKVESLLKKSNIQANSFIVLPEMFSTGFDVKSALTIDGEDMSLTKAHDFLSKLAKKYKSFVQGSGISLDTITNKRQNLSVVFNSNGELISTYQKIHPFSYANEDKYFSYGEEVKVCQVGEFMLSHFICYDLRFPEIFRHASLNGCEIISVIANWPKKRIKHWESLLIARAIENQCYVIGVNRVGKDPWSEYNGNSIVVSPKGDVLNKPNNKEGIIELDICHKDLVEYRNNFPILDDLQKKWLGM